MVNATVPIEKEGACIERDKEEEMMNVTISFEKEKAGIEFLREEVLVQASKAAEKMREVIPMVDDVVELSSKKDRRNVNSISKHKMVTRFSKHHCSDSDPVEAEVVKVLEIGAAIGFDFSGIEKEVAEVIAVREKEDDARFEAIFILEIEVEKLVRILYCFKSIELVSGSVEAEVANTLAVGAAIGIDFSEVEEEVMEEITRREYEDLARCAANSG
ncbi:hypothetical protein LWI29_013842 [Acer saccharum]|uniref:Uncharacterized protein n=1 Tax=Acer saccharum TaxID=4024 RepID=A0AA39SSH8_ACESA|nr:hypothetical protein LWI29_013842 [Acer saccharum]